MPGGLCEAQPERRSVWSRTRIQAERRSRLHVDGADYLRDRGSPLLVTLSWMRVPKRRWLLWACVIASCGKDPSPAAAPHPGPDGDPPASDPPAQAGSEETGEDESARLKLETEFHRTRFGLGTGLWVLGVVSNPHAERVTDVRLRVRLLDEEASMVGSADARLGRPLEASERAAVAVQVAKPVAHEQLELEATAITDEGPAPEAPTLKLVHEPPQRADLGGWYVVGTVQNLGTAAVEDARVEIQSFDRQGMLLGIDWLDLDPVPAGETIEFEVGDLRYEEPPKRFLLVVR